MTLTAETKPEKAVLDIYRKLYKEATPSADFDELVDSGETLQAAFFDKYYLDEGTQNRIMEEICKEYKLSKSDTRKVKETVTLGCSPRCFKAL